MELKVNVDQVELLCATIPDNPSVDFNRERRKNVDPPVDDP
jgi:hypothetical protein